MKPQSLSRPLSAAQKQLLAGQLLAPDTPMCNMALACTIEGSIDADLITHAWNDVTTRHDALSIRVDVGDSDITQSAGHQPPSMELIDLSENLDPRDDARNWMRKSVSTAIDSQGVLGIVRLIKLSQTQWIFFCNLHHIICDATSFALLWRDLADTYTALSSDIDESDRDSKPGDFIAFTQTMVQASASIEKPDYINLLQDIAPPAPFGRKPQRSDTSSTRVSQSLTNERTSKLAVMASLPQARGFGQGIGHCNVLLTILTALLYRLTGESIQTIGLPLPQRQNPDYRNTVGLMVEVLPLQVQIDKDSTFINVLEQARISFLGVLKEARAGDSTHLDAQAIPVLLNYINAPLGDFGELPTQVEWLHSGHIDSQHLLRLQVEDWVGDGNITLSFDFNDAVFDVQQRTQTIDAFWHLFDAMSENLDHCVEDVSITNARVLRDSQNPFDTDQGTVFERISDNFQKLADQSAIISGSVTRNYDQLESSVHHIAQLLNEAGVAAGDRVAVYLHRDSRLPQILLGIHCCAAAYIPLDAQQPAQRVAEILSDSDAQLLITSSDLAGEIEFSNTILVDQFFQTPPNTTLATSTNKHTVKPAPNDTAYIIYTSGSTGLPKGVSVSHQSLANYCNWAARFYAQDKPLSMPLFTPIGFDLTVTALFLPLLTGGVLHVYDEREYPGGDALSAVINDDSVDTIKLTPAHLGLLTEELCSSSRYLTQIIVGGENLPASLAARVCKLFSDKVSIHNEYGPTEATVGCVLHTFDADTDQQGSVPIGTPIAGCSLRILNDAGQDQLPGCIGELYVAGASLATGYWQQPQLTQSRFAKLGPDDTRFYRTGDLVREGDDGLLHCLGRTDSQFKLRGHRIEPAEIESIALQNPAVKTCVAVLTSPQSALLSTDQKCNQCGLSSHAPGAQLDESGVCMLCRNFTRYRERVDGYFRPIQEFHDIVSGLSHSKKSEYDCIMLLSGGKDSTYALAQLVDMGLTVLAFTLDNGFISESAKDNIERVCTALGVEHRYGHTSSMNDIFLDSLQRHANVCNGCFKTIYTMALEIAVDNNIDCIVTGLSRGQFFETRLSEDWFMAPDYRSDAMDEAIIAARKAYHRMEDAVSCGLNTDFLKDDEVFERIKIVDFYRYSDVHLDEMYQYLDKRLPWVRPSDTGRSTNCLINDAGIYVHKRERGFHNYAHPYSWDVRLGHKQRDAALEELDDEIDERSVLSHLDEIGYQLAEQEPERIALYYTCDSSLSEADLRRWLATHLPGWMTPTWLVELPSLPLSLNGKIDRQRLPVPAMASAPVTTPGMPRGFAGKVIKIHREPDSDPTHLEPQSDQEQLLARIWCRHLHRETIGVSENFFALGGDSLMAIRITSELNRSGHAYRPADIFENQTIATLAQIDLASRATKDTPDDLADNTQAAAFSSISSSQLDALSRVLKKD